MLSEFFESPIRVQALRGGPAGNLFDGFAGVLFREGYAELTARRHLRAAEHFTRWADRAGVPTGCLTRHSLGRFNRHLRRCRCPHFAHADRLNVLHGARLFLRYLEETGVVGMTAVEIQEPVLLVAFCDWMRRQRGTCQGTLNNYLVHLRSLLRLLGEDPARIDARNLRQFVLEGSRSCGWSVAKQRTTALRMFLRFLVAEGRCSPGLDAAVPVLAHWRLDSLPRYLQDDEVEQVIAACGSTSPVGRRDRAILLLLARLGLRAGDIVQLRLGDIDWREAWIQVSGKNQRATRLPLTQEVGQALATYVHCDRPRTDSDAVFVRCRAPFRPFRSHCAVSVIVARSFRRAGVTRPSRGAAHLLRHSVATSLLRHGASLQDIAALLRHHSLETTQIYAKVDVNALREIAQPWPEVPSC